MDVEIRAEPDLRAFLRPISLAFGSEPAEEHAARFAQLIDPARAHAAYVEGELVGSAGAYDFELSVPGGIVPAAGVAAVAVLPTHRRRGILTRLMRAQLDDARRRGDAVAILWASEEGIYGRFGYGVASLGMGLEIDPARAGFRADPGPSGAVRIVGEEEAWTAIPPVYERVRLETPGMTSRSEGWWRARRLYDSPQRPAGYGSLFRAVLSLGGVDEAYALYRVKSQWAGGSFANEVDVVEALGSSAEATREIWRYLFALDLVAVLRADRLPVDHPLVLMLEQPRRLRMTLGDALWCRILDVEAALAGRALGKGSVVLELADGFLPGSTGRWRIGAGGATRTEEEPDLALAVAELGSVYLGGFTFGELVRAGQVRELRPGGAARGDEVLYAPRAPWCPEIF